jgi:3-isopropylmalate/(R)-2-methylmalate dehydratase small subunit
MIKGKVWKYGDNVNTDVMYPAKYLVHFDKEEVSKHAMEGIDPEFSKKVSPGDLIVAGNNFGSGSAREQAAMTLKYAGIGAILADTFNRTFYRNAINIGLPVISYEGISKLVAEGDTLEVELDKGIISNITKGEKYETEPTPPFLLEIIELGGAIPYYKQRLR